ncbi:MAG: hypothetical protein O8C61_02515 [Candidatus Methanoperedens sp.]|nr:hypothetical protein [Candidatus Methanoperedens sp.]
MSPGTKDACNLAVCHLSIVIHPTGFMMNNCAYFINAVAAEFQEACEPESGVMFRIFRV